MTDLRTMTAAELTARYNDLASKSVKKGSYPKTKLIKMIEALEPEIEEISGPDGKTCPLCGETADQDPAGNPGTFLGDGALKCSACEKAYGRFNGVEIAMGKVKPRKIVNPQYKINAKVNACKAEGIEIIYVKGERLWNFVDAVEGRMFMQMKSAKFAEYTPADLAKYAARRMKKKG